MDTDFEIFLSTAPGLEAVLAEEAVHHGFAILSPQMVVSRSRAVGPMFGARIW